MNADRSHEASAARPNSAKCPAQGFADILALTTSSRSWSAALLTAVDLASRWNANITGCYVPVSLRSQGADENDPSVMSLLTESDGEAPDESDAFYAFATDLGAHHASWAVTHVAIAPTLHQLGAWHDLAVIERDMVDETRVFDILGEAMLGSRIPCILLPPQWNDTFACNRIVIGWNGSIEATRALHGALPLLQLAEQVILVHGEARAPFDHQTGVTVPDPVAYLRHHGVAAKPHRMDAPANEAGRSLLQKAHDVRADLLVMGAYGHSRLRERLLGGATRHVMANADIPVFMQH